MMFLYIKLQSRVRGFRTLAEGDKVEFEVMKDQKGYKATKVRKL